VVKAFYNAGYLAENDYLFWIQALNDRNGLSHRYDEQAYQQIFKSLPKYTIFFSELVKIIEEKGESSMTGGRLKRVAKYLHDEEAFFFTYGDGISNLDITKTLAFHRSHGKLATLTASLPPGRFGALDIHNNQVKSFKEKPRGDGALINGGFFVLSPKVIEYIENDQTVWEQYPLNQLVADRQLMCYEHQGFWQPMEPYGIRFI